MSDAVKAAHPKSQIMLEQLLSDWRFLSATAALLLVIGESRYKLRRVDRLLDEKTLAAASRDNATMVAELKSLSVDVSELKIAMARFSEKYDVGTARLWSSFEAATIDCKERLAKLEGKMNSR